MKSPTVKRVYRDSAPAGEREAMDAIKRDDVVRLRQLPVDLAHHHDNWKFIQDVCVQLSAHHDWIVRGTSLLALRYATHRFRCFEKNIIKPVLLRGLKDPKPEVVFHAEESIAEINWLMKWRIGGAKKQKLIEKRFDEKHRANNSPDTTRGK